MDELEDTSYVVMRADLSSVLAANGRMMFSESPDVAERVAKLYCGVAMTWKEAKALMWCEYGNA